MNPHFLPMYGLNSRIDLALQLLIGRRKTQNSKWYVALAKHMLYIAKERIMEFTIIVSLLFYFFFFFDESHINESLHLHTFDICIKLYANNV